jgi:hypothetical protein
MQPVNKDGQHGEDRMGSDWSLEIRPTKNPANKVLIFSDSSVLSA